MPEASKCKACGADIIWVRSATCGIPIPLNAKASRDGDVAILNGVAVSNARNLVYSVLLSGPWYIEHTSTCPELRKLCKKK
jgi:hypothetical protein